ncbi:hypothetical protein OG689_43065 [Kitasatospora sp. NBC_00240]|uniref:hypothetical protein n=1 Tax=Kitasatospora sp. NBC_00240 TaxID=2903567 RepID=UPI0022502979|nr:hypothetical protein [Kitasatospora sp. NBC_00240]MCX5215926.1 hypothetical protein [Kitasatospora sp. NBC_00240]
MTTYTGDATVSAGGSPYPCHADLSRWTEPIPARPFARPDEHIEGQAQWAGTIVLQDADATLAVRHGDDRQLTVKGPAAAFLVTGWSPGSTELRIRGNSHELPL